MQAFSEKIIFFDAEFSSLDPYHGEILSVGLVKPDGSQLYLELEFDGDYDPWVKKNVLPHLGKTEKVSRRKARNQMKKFVGKSRPFLLSYVNHFDSVFLIKIFGDKEKWPFFWIPLDFATMLFTQRQRPDALSGKNTQLYRQLGIDYQKYQKHNALDDALLLREVYLKMLENN